MAKEIQNSTIQHKSKEFQHTHRIIITALFTALTCVSTMIIKIPTPTLGYIHPGDGFVLLSGLILGPVYGTLAAGLGSALADLFSGYLVYVPATFIIKALTALTAFLLFSMLCNITSSKANWFKLLISGSAGEIVMVFGYFVFEILMLSVSSHTNLSAGIIASIAGIIPNLIQAVFGVIICNVLYPILTPLLPAMKR